MPLPLAEIVPELLMPPAKVDTMTVPPELAWPPTTMPLPPVAEIVPALLMPPVKLDT